MTYTTVANDAVIERTVQALGARTNIVAEVASDRASALDLLVAKLPEGVDIFPGTSRTLEEIGFLDYLSRNPERYRNLRNAGADESDPAVRAQVRRVTTSTADYFVGSVHAVTEAGEVVIASRTGSQVAPYAYSARNVIWVIGAQKIVPTLEEALQRVRTHAFALEGERMKQTGAEGTSIGKILIVENEWRAGRVSIIIVRELLGF